MSERSRVATWKTHKLKPIHVPVGPHEVVYITMLHPFRHHGEPVPRPVPQHAEQGQHVRVSKEIPRYDFLVEVLTECSQYASIYKERRIGINSRESFSACLRWCMSVVP